jgi:hypothetical protein
MSNHAKAATTGIAPSAQASRNIRRSPGDVARVGGDAGDGAPGDIGPVASAPAGAPGATRVTAFDVTPFDLGDARNQRPVLVRVVADAQKVSHRVRLAPIVPAPGGVARIGLV